MNGDSGPRARRHGCPSIPAILTALAVAAILSGCSFGAWKEDYLGVDLITNRNLSAADFADAYVGGASPAFDYVNYEEIPDSAEYGGTSGLPAAPGAVYRLELVNLMRNGDFETTAASDPPAEWTVDGGAILLGDNTPGLAITGMSASFTVAANDAAFCDLRNGSTGLLDLFVHPGEYHLNLMLRRTKDDRPVDFDYGSMSQSHLAVGSGISWKTHPDPDNPDFDVEAFPNDTNNDVVNVFSVAEDTEHYLYIGAPENAAPVISQHGYVDDIRIGRVDNLPHVALSLGPATLDGFLDIVPGLHRFSVYVKSEIDAEVTPATANAFRAAQIRIGINDDYSVTTIADAGWSSSEWIQVSTETVITLSDIAQTNAVTLTLTVTSIETPTVGRILISSPTFELVVR